MSRNGRIDSGRRTVFATIQQRTQTPDECGDPTDSWSTYKKVWCYLAQLKGREMNYAKQIVDSAEYKAVIPYKPSVTTRMRLKVGSSTYYNIVAVMEGDMHTNELELLLTKAVD